MELLWISRYSDKDKWFSHTSGWPRIARHHSSSKEYRNQRDQVFISETESKTWIFRVSITRPSPRLEFSKSQFWDQVQDCNSSSLNPKTQIETKNFWVLILILSLRYKDLVSQIWCMVVNQNLVCVLIKIKSETRFYLKLIVELRVFGPHQPLSGLNILHEGHHVSKACSVGANQCRQPDLRKEINSTQYLKVNWEYVKRL